MPKTVSSKWRNKKRSTYVLIWAFTLVVPFILFSYFAFEQNSRSSSTVQFVSILFRHGERTPTSFYPNDPYKDPKNWPEGLGALTKIGKQQIYKLGKMLRERYQGFLSETYSPEDIYIFSSDHDRCLMSAQLCLAGLYPPVKDQIWEKNLNWQPIPVHTIPRSLDKLLVVKKPCPKYEKELNQTYYTDFFNKTNADNAELYKYLTEHSGMLVKDIMQLEFLYNILEVEANLNYKLPDWAEKVYNEKTRDLATLALASFTFSDVTKRLKGGLLLGEIVQHMSQKVLGSLKPNRLAYLYSGHDLTIISLLRALGFEELIRPENGAAVIFELHQPTHGGDHLVQLLYLNNTEQSQPVMLKIPGCGDTCKLKDFLTITKPYIPDDWESECQDV